MYDRRKEQKLYELAFREYGGLLVVTRKPSFRGMLKLSEAEGQLGVGLLGEGLVGERRIRAFMPAVEAFAEALVSWDLVALGVQAPATLEGLLAEDYRFVVDVVRTWYKRVALRIDTEPEVEDSPPVEEPAPEDAAEEMLAMLPTFPPPPAPVSSDGEPAPEDTDSPSTDDVVNGREMIHAGPPAAAQ